MKVFNRFLAHFLRGFVMTMYRGDESPQQPVVTDDELAERYLPGGVNKTLLNLDVELSVKDVDLGVEVTDFRASFQGIRWSHFRFVGRMGKVDMIVTALLLNIIVVSALLLILLSTAGNTAV